MGSAAAWGAGAGARPGANPPYCRRMALKHLRQNAYGASPSVLKVALKPGSVHNSAVRVVDNEQDVRFLRILRQVGGHSVRNLAWSGSFPDVLPFNEQMPTVKRKVWDHASTGKRHRRVFPLQFVAPRVEESPQSCRSSRAR